MSLQVFVYAPFGGKARNRAIQYFVRLEVDFVEISIQPPFGQQGSLTPPTALFEVVKVHPAVLADLIAGLFAK